ncbi:MAG: acyl-CoA dehydrogenase family protein [Actinomycetota bacterium]|jgi:alkylation response protein AidB-like acyl-CoA dehydrogenase
MNSPETETLLARVAEIGPTFRERMRELDVGSSFPFQNLAEAQQADLHKLTVPREHGGFGYWRDDNYSGFYRILEQLAYWDTNTAQLLQVHNHAVGIVGWHATPEQRELFLPQIVGGAFCASLGSEAHIFENGAEHLESELHSVPGGYRLTTRKAFASVAAIAKYLLVWCAVEGTASYADRMLFALVPTDSPGVTLLDDWDMLGMRSTVSCGVVFDDVFVPDSHLIGTPGCWVNNDPRTFSCAYATNHLGTAQGAFDFIAGYVAARDDLRESEAVRVRLGRMDAQLFATRSALYATAARLDRGDDPDDVEADAVRTMHLAKNAVLSIPYEGFDIVGARAAHQRYPLGQMMRDARTFTLHFRDDLYVQRLAVHAMGGGFSAKRGRGGSTPFDQAHAGA